MKLTKKIVALFILGLLLLPVASRMVQASETPESVSINFTGVFDDNNSSINFQTSATFGANFSLAAPSRSSYSFAYWIVNGVVRYDLGETSSIKVTSNMNLSAVYSPDGKNTVLFIDSNGEILGTYFVTSGQTVASPSLASHVGKPGLIVKTEDTWKTPQGTVYSTELIIESNTVFILQYEVENQENTFTIAVNNGSGAGTYVYNQIVTVSANPVDFSHWEENGVEVSRLLNYSFTVVSSRTLTAVSQVTPEADLPIVTMTDDLELRSGFHTYMGQFYLPTGYELIEYGFLLSDTIGTITRSTPGVIVAQNNQKQALTNEFVMSFPTSSHRTSRAYVVYQTGETITTAYSVNIEQYTEKYVVTFDSNGGTQPYSQSIFPNQKATSPVSTKDNYVLFGWFEDEELTTLFDFDTNITANMTLYAKWEQVIIETFATSTATATYANGSFVGVNSLTWNYVHSRNEGDYPITGSGLMLRRSDEPSSLSTTKSNGLSSFSFDVRKAFTGDTQRRLRVTLSSGETVLDTFEYQEETLIFPSGASETIISISENNINLSGNITVTFELFGATGNQQLTIDNIEFVDYTPNLSNETKVELDKQSLSLPERVTTTSNLNLVSSGLNGSNISWEYLNPSDPNNSLINLETGLTQVILTDITKTISLLATISLGDVTDQKEFTVIIGKTDAQRVADDKAVLSIQTSITDETSIALPLSGANGTTISWSSSNPSIISNSGDITTPSETTIVTMTATISYGAESDTKEFNVQITVASETGSIMIYEFYPAGGNSGATFKQKYIIIYNSTNSSYSLTNHSLQYASSTGAFNTRVNISGTISAKSYFIILLNTGSNGVDFPYILNIDLTISLSPAATAGKIALSKSNRDTIITGPNDINVVDFLGYGTAANQYEGTSYAPAPSTTLGLRRNSFVDNNNNSTDFSTILLSSYPTLPTPE